LSLTLADLQALERDWVMRTYIRQPVEFVRGEGCRLWDAESNEYLDFLAGISVVQIGHSHPALVEAIREQAGRLMHVSNLYYTEPGMRLAKRLAESSLGGKVFFCNSGAEANECAIKLARRHRSAGEFVVLTDGFHGRTYGSLSATPQEPKQAPFAPLVPGFKGIHPIADEVLVAAREACDRHGALLVFDEVQCGMGRTGTLWAYEQTPVKPDVMTVAKGLGGGLPIGACIASPEYADTLKPGDHGSTFAGGPVPCAAANAVFDVVHDAAFLDEVRAKGELLLEGLERLPVENVRGRGLMTAFDTDSAPEVAGRLLSEQRLVVNATGPATIRLLPPLTVTREEIEEALRRIAEALA
jgi:acetylornithine/N-succinyldiaminopimelate aminotransferase